VIDLVAPGMDKESARECRSHRYNHVVYMSQLVSNPRGLLTHMGLYNVILSGSRAAGYFHPGSCVDDSDWDFFIGSSLRNVIEFSRHMKVQGVEWETIPDTLESTENTDREYESLSLLTGTLYNNGRCHKIHLIWATWGGIDVFKPLLKFHSSIVQCFIGSFAACSMYESLSSKGLSLAWSTSNLATSSRARQKYRTRGIKYISYERWWNKDKDDYGDVFDDSMLIPRIRRFGDEMSNLVWLHEFLDLTDLPDRWRGNIDAYCWIEKPYRIDSISRQDASGKLPSGFFDARVVNFYRELLLVVSKRKAESLHQRAPWMSRETIEASCGIAGSLDD